MPPAADFQLFHLLSQIKKRLQNVQTGTMLSGSSQSEWSYSKNHKISDTGKIAVTILKMWTIWFYHRNNMSTKYRWNDKQCRHHDQSSQIWAYTVCQDLSVRKIMIIYGSVNWIEPGHGENVSYANNKGADQPAHPRSLISAFVVHCLDSIISLDSITEI